MQVFKVGQKLLILKLEELNLVKTDGPASEFEFSPNDENVALVTEFGILELYNIHNGRKIAESEIYTGSINTIALSPNQKQVACGYTTGVIKSWDLTTGLLIFSTKQKMEIKELKYNENGETILFKGQGRFFKEYFYGEKSGIIDSMSGELIRYLDDKYNKDLNGLNQVISHDERFLFSALPGKIEIIDRETGNIIGGFETFIGVPYFIESTQLSPSKYEIFIGGEYGVLQGWEVTIGNIS